MWYEGKIWMILANNRRNPVEQLTLNPATRRALRLIGERGAFNGTMRSHRLVVRTSPFHGEDVRAIRAESDFNRQKIYM